MSVFARLKSWTSKPTGDLPTAIAEAAAELSLSPAMAAALNTVLQGLKSASPELVEQLSRIVAEQSSSLPQYAALAKNNADTLRHEKRWLAELIGQALAAQSEGWAALYLATNHKNLLVQRVDHILNPRTHIQMPSAFVYAMQ